MSRTCLCCQKHDQRPRSVREVLTDPGSRMQAPWILRSRRGSPQFTPKMGPDTVLVRPDREMWRARALRAKAAAFSQPALRRNSKIHIALASWRDAGRETYPPHFTLLPMPP